MKKLLIFIMLVLIIFTIFTGCSNPERNKNEPESTKPILNLEGRYSGEINVIFPIDSRYSFLPEQEHINAWESYVRNKYNSNINLIYTQRVDEFIANEENEVAGIKIDEVKEISESGGLIYLYNIADIKVLADYGMLMPLNKFIKDISGNEYIDISLYDSLRDNYNNLWGIPLHESSYSASRIYNKYWLSNADMSVPTTIDEFLNYAKYVKNKDPDGDGLNNTFISWYSINTLESDFRDVFRAFECYTSDNIGPIAYNPIDKEYQIMGLTEKFVEAITFIKNLIDEGLIISFDEIDEGVSKRKAMIIASATTSLNNYLSDVETSYGFYIEGNSDMYLIEKSPIYIVAILTNTIEPDKQMSEFLHMFYASPDCRYDFAFGIKDYDYFEEEKFYKYIPFTNGMANTMIGLDTRLNDEATLEKPLVSEADGVTRIISNQNYFDLKTEAEELDSKLFYSVPLAKQDPLVHQLNWKIRTATHEFYNEILIENIPLETAIEGYRKKLDELGVLEILKGLNSN